MKDSKILRGICYVLIPVLIAVLILSSLYLCFVNEGYYSSEEAYFKSTQFKSPYMYEIRDLMDELIFAQSDYKMIQDGENTIYYSNSFYPMFGMENFANFLVIYQNKAITNIKFTENTNTLEKIKAQVLESKKNNFCYENSQYTSNVEGFANDADEYFSSIKIEYYTKDSKTISSYYDSTNATDPVVISQNEITDVESDNTIFNEVEDSVLEATMTSAEVANPAEPKSNIEYRTAYIEDFTFYTSFNPTLGDKNNDIKFVMNTLQTLQPYEQVITISIPVASILILIMSLYLINSIGHVKGEKEIEITDFDKVPLEIIIFVFLIVIAICIAILQEISVDNWKIETLIALFSTMYIVNMILLEITCVTSIKRIKAKKFLDTCICGKLFKWSLNLCKKILRKSFDILHKISEKMKNAKKSLNENVSLTWKLIIVIGGYIIVSGLLLGIMGPIGAIIDLAVFIYALYEILLRLNSFKRLEESLKRIYEGEKVTLYATDFTNEFEKSVTYINDISNGFENAVQESLKSERLKTELITNVSHDIKTPLTSIINYVDLIKKENVENEKVKEYIEILDSKSQRLKKLTEDLVEASKASSGNVNLNFETIGIVELLNQLIGEYKDKFEEKKLEIISNLSEENIKIKADSRYLYRVIDNLFGNISKYALDNSRVYIETATKENKVKIILKNISKERLNITEEELMQRFVRGDKSRTTEGSGLGLAIARSLTELQKGTLNCKIDGDLFKVEIEFDII